MSKIRREKDGSYTIDFIKTIEGKRIHISKKGFVNEESALRQIPILLEKRLSLIKKIKASSKFSSFFEEYLEHRSRKISESTLLSIKTIYNTILIRYADMEVYDVFNIHNILHLHKEIITNPNSGEKWKNRVIGELRLMVDYACFLKLISPEDASDEKMILENLLITKKAKERDCYTPYQLKKFLSVVDNPDDKELLTTYAYLGTRISEFIGLTWDCYDSRNRTIEIKQQILYLAKGKPVLTERLKTKESYRKCKLNNEVYEILETRKQRCSVGYIFPKNIKTPYEPLPKATLRRMMFSYMDKAKLPRISPHGFRHTKATMFMSVCKTMAEVKSAARFLGHSVTMMMETYAHAEEKTIDVIIKRLDEK